MIQVWDDERECAESASSPGGWLGSPHSRSARKSQVSEKKNKFTTIIFTTIFTSHT